MAIVVVCPGCHKRFQVSEKFAGRKGPCPKCKTEITIPSENEEVVVHAPETFGPKGAKGRAVLKPIFREYTKFSPAIAFGAVAGALSVCVVALILRSNIQDKANFPLAILVMGTIVLAPPLVWAGYSFLRDDELEPFKGKDLWIRVAVCSVLYALIWAFVAFMNSNVYEGSGYPMPMLAVVVPLMMVAGAGSAFVSLDMEFFMGLLHYGLFLVVTLLLRLLVGISAFPLAQ